MYEYTDERRVKRREDGSITTELLQTKLFTLQQESTDGENTALRGHMYTFRSQELCLMFQ